MKNDRFYFELQEMFGLKNREEVLEFLKSLDNEQEAMIKEVEYRAKQHDDTDNCWTTKDLQIAYNYGSRYGKGTVGSSQKYTFDALLEHLNKPLKNNKDETT